MKGFELDPEANALYVRIDVGDVAQTIELEECVFIDIDSGGHPLGIEFVNADDFMPFLRRHAGHLDIPENVYQTLSESVFAVSTR